ncbi:PBP1A family penicillin-binding protein [Candidatus Microgenomates bacterium]|nr:PBP1A family penicillin-binding protein [Candidatus Microgenomates bacterium]
MKIIYYILYFAINVLIFIGDALRFIVKKIIWFVGTGANLVKRVAHAILSIFRLIYSPISSLLNNKHKRNSIKKHQKATFSPLPKRRKKRAILGMFFKLKYFVIGFITSFIVFVSYQSYLLVKSLPSPTNIGKVNYALSTHIYDRAGKQLFEIYRDENRTPVRLNDMPPYIYEASIAIEDKDFFKHKGVSFIGGIGRAIKEAVVNRNFKGIQGGSTITQQLVKSSLLSPERTLLRKAREMLLALWTERLYTKRQVLEMYLNQVPYGGSAYGIEEAAQTFYGKHARELTIAEAALLAGLPQAPSAYSPFVNPNLAKSRRNDVLLRMYEQGYIDAQDYAAAQSKEVTIAQPSSNIDAPHFVFYTKGELEKEFGIRDVEEGGLNVYTSLDSTIQKKAEEILSEEIAKIRNLNVSNGAILVTKPSTGEILAMVGSKNYYESPYGAFNVTTATRQPGSSIKPLVYSMAIEHGMTSMTQIDDSPTNFSQPGAEPYRPVNYDERFHGRVTLRMALANSYNIPAVKTLQSIGLSDFIGFAKTLGISTWGDSSRYGLSLALGGGEVTMVDMGTAYGVFANLGAKMPVTPFLKITQTDGKVLYERSKEPRRVMSEESAYILSDIMSDNIARIAAFGPRSALEIPGYKVAVKTGTTDSKKDNWTIGYTPDYLVVVWVGNNDNTPMNQALTSGITGAAPIWNKMMSYLLTNYSTKESWYKKPANIVEVACGGNKREVFVRGTERAFCRGSQPFTSGSTR